MSNVNAHLFVVEDDEDIAMLLRDYLTQAGFSAQVLDSGAEVMEAFHRERPAMVLLDIGLPGEDGFSICRKLRAASTVPIMMITARVDEIDRLLGLELGADDYVCKPFSPREVVARVKAVLRRGENRKPELEVDEKRYIARFRDVEIPLTKVECALLGTLVRKPEVVFSRGQLSDHAYGDGRIVADRTIDSHIKNIRRKLSDAGVPDVLGSVYGAGYRFEPRNFE